MARGVGGARDAVSGESTHHNFLSQFFHVTPPKAHLHDHSHQPPRRNFHNIRAPPRIIACSIPTVKFSITPTNIPPHIPSPLPY